MTQRRRILIAFPLPLALALAACGSGGGGERGSGGPPLGFELAMASVSAGEDGASADNAPAPTPLITLSPEQLAAKLAAGNIRLIDVRTDAEVAEGTIPGAEHIPLDRFDPAALDLSDGREVVLYCRSDRRSGIAAAKLAEATGEPATHLEGGILAWQQAGQPIDQP